ncbi:folate-binding protein YgfZ [Sphingobium sp. B2D3A]|uniref:CAF17-like 4Fe-4S cluster assembly/insertion protein YgfZ n=1 Tax=unclassified Sphingobium TaxID=2611147 RepID=UPI00222434BE|nr:MULTISPECIES: folate-binding protein [unclassified Sphingobium]MCW2336151.1 folate-binding protein YgfZ [Sphingobium sp. B2D3A]MCW2385906.1 folate-binding protein YgfZ [Sphingobium sp. B2D3D]MCW2389408.1 folate-binding protein YgfZ [Sphingobium sp. B11D3B]
MSATTPLATPPLATTLRDRAILRVGGAEARPFLQGLLTQDVLSLQPGAPRYAGLLTPQGKALYDMLLWADPAGGEDVLIDCEASRVEALARRLTLYRLRRPVTIGIEEGLAAHWSADPVDGASTDPRLAALGWRWLAPAGEDDASDMYRAHRLAQGVPEGVAELGDDKTLWLECNAEELHGVDYGKGCYVGQENTARMHYRNKVNRRLVVVPLDRSDPARLRIAYPALGLAVDHRPVDSLEGITLPDWQADALAEDAE